MVYFMFHTIISYMVHYYILLINDTCWNLSQNCKLLFPLAKAHQDYFEWISDYMLIAGTLFSIYVKLKDKETLIERKKRPQRIVAALEK